MDRINTPFWDFNFKVTDLLVQTDLGNFYIRAAAGGLLNALREANLRDGVAIMARQPPAGAEVVSWQDLLHRLKSARSTSAAVAPHR